MRNVVRSARNYDTRAASKAVATVSGVETFPDRAVQSEKANCDINVIVERYGLTGQMPPNYRSPEYGDFDGVSDFQSAMESVRAAREQFMLLPAKVRSRFGNDPQQLLVFMADTDNAEEAIKLGLASRRDPVILPATESEIPQARNQRENDNVRYSDEGVVGRSEAPGDAARAPQEQRGSPGARRKG